MNLADLVEAMHAFAPEGARVVLRGDGETRIGDLTQDSRTAVPGSLFIARRGLTSDGRAYIVSAVESGASAVLTDADGAERVPEGTPVLVAGDPALAAAFAAEAYHRRPSSRLRCVGVTGTNGKSTVAGLLHQALNHAGVRTGLIGTVEIDDGREVAPAEMTTPPAIELSRALGVMTEHDCRGAAMEVSSHALHQGRADALSFAAAVFTNLTPEHLDYHGTLEAYGEAKARLLDLLDGDGVVVLNAGDAWSRSLADRRTPGLVRLCGEGEDADWRIEIDGPTMLGCDLRLRTPIGEIAGRTALAGVHNVMNLAQALCAADAVLEREGVGGAERLHALTDALPSLRAPAGRLQRVEAEGRDLPTVFIDYAHTGDALERTLRGVRELLDPGARLWVVFGAGGERDRAKRPVMGRIGSTFADAVVITSDNPRREDPSAIIAEILEGVPADARERVLVHADRARAIRAAIDGAAAGDVVVVAGKGHERTQVVAGAEGGVRSVAFDDAQQARAAMDERAARGVGP
ncbi:MAG: UDP-N-acetylmuramoyl-L-alanyl-D-glutamate--2,6-diaminopimelate ligase [Planctomycetota bacterium]